MKCLNVTELLEYNSPYEIFDREILIIIHCAFTVWNTSFHCGGCVDVYREGYCRNSFCLPTYIPSVPWTELRPNTAGDFLCHPLLTSRKTPDIHDYIIVAFPSCPEAGLGDGKTGLTLNYLYSYLYYLYIICTLIFYCGIVEIQNYIGFNYTT